MRSSNPMLKRLDDNTIAAVNDGSVMTMNGTVTSFLLLALVLLLPAAVCWNWVALGYMDRVIPTVVISSILGIILALFTTFKPNWSPITAPIYALCEGFILGGLSAMLEAQMPGIVIQAVAITILTSVVMAVLYKTGLIQVTQKFRAVLFILTFSIAALYLVSFFTALFGFTAISQFLWSATPISIGVSAVICVVAALNLLIDFDHIEYFSQNYAPKYMEWYCAFGLLVTIVWLYVEILRLLSKLNRR